MIHGFETTLLTAGYTQISKGGTNCPADWVAIVFYKPGRQSNCRKQPAKCPD